MQTTSGVDENMTRPGELTRKTIPVPVPPYRIEPCERAGTLQRSIKIALH